MMGMQGVHHTCWDMRNLAPVPSGRGFLIVGRRPERIRGRALSETNTATLELKRLRAQWQRKLWSTPVKIKSAL
jgi:hypothetical protein